MMSEVQGVTQAEIWQLGECWLGCPTQLAGHQGVDTSGAGMACLACYDYLATRPSGMPQYQEGLKAAVAARETPQHTLNCDWGRGRCPAKGGRCPTSH